MRIILLASTVCGGLISGLAAQEVYYFGVNSEPLEHSEQAIQRKEVVYRNDHKLTISTEQQTGDQWVRVSREKISSNGQREWVIRYRAEDLFSSKFYRQYEETEPGHYFFREYSLTSDIRRGSTSRKFPLSLEGEVTEYYPGGAVKSVSEYHDNQLIANKNWLEDGTPYIDSIFYSADLEPEYEYGPDFFRNYIVQKLARSEWDLSQIRDLVIIGWVIMENGEMKGIRAMEGKSEQLNSYLVNIISEIPGKWQPARLNGKTVRYFMRYPFNFQVRDVNFQEVGFSTGQLYYNKY
ncbi:MAG: hypothetical protein ACWGNV_00635 [Bacteroidales bacterium]